MVPWIKFELRDNDSSLVSLHNSIGISPEIWFLLRSIKVSCWYSPNAFGIEPVILASERTNEFSEVRGCKFEGNGPWRSNDLNVRPMTSEFLLHETPNHLHGFLSKGSHELRRFEEVLSVFFHERRARPWSSMENEKGKKMEVIVRRRMNGGIGGYEREFGGRGAA